MQPIITLYLVPIVSLSISIKSEFIDSESFPILRSFLSWYCRDSCIYRHTPPPPLFLSIILFKTIMSHIIVNMIWFYPSFR